MYRIKRFWSLALVVPMLGLLGGCGDSDEGPEVSGVEVTGQVQVAGKPLKLNPETTLTVTFVKADQAAPAGPATQAGQQPLRIESRAEYDPATSNFVVKGPTGKGIPPGQYRVTLSAEIYGEGEDSRFVAFSGDRSPLVANVGSTPGQKFNLDLRKRKVVTQ